MGKKIVTVWLLLTVFIVNAWACTNLIVGKKASADGSVIVSYSADSYGMFGFLCHYPAAINESGVMRDIYEWDTGKYLGQIKEAKQTYNVIGNMNEFQVTIGETTFGGRPELVDSTGIMDYGSLIYVALQRSRTAKEAIKVMTDLVKEYGYYSSGESFTVADPNEGQKEPVEEVTEDSTQNVVEEKVVPVLTSFVFEASKNAQYLIKDIECTIKDSTITALIPYVTEISELIPTFEGVYDKVSIGNTVQRSPLYGDGILFYRPAYC